MRSLGVDRLVVSKVLNHAESGITRVYDRYAADPEKAAAMERWANRLREIIADAHERNVVQLGDAGSVTVDTKAKSAYQVPYRRHCASHQATWSGRATEWSRLP